MNVQWHNWAYDTLTIHVEVAFVELSVLTLSISLTVYPRHGWIFSTFLHVETAVKASLKAEWKSM